MTVFGDKLPDTQIWTLSAFGRIAATKSPIAPLISACSKTSVASRMAMEYFFSTEPMFISFAPQGLKTPDVPLPSGRR